VQEALSLRFAETVRTVTAAARPSGWVTPSFRSPPGVAGAQRTLRRRPDGSTVVAVALRQRPWPAVLADMIEGVVVINRLAPPEADAARSALWRTMLQFTLATAQSPGGAAPKVA